MRKTLLSKIEPLFLLKMLLLLLLQRRSLCLSLAAQASFVKSQFPFETEALCGVETATGAILISDADRRRDGTEEEL